MGCSDNGSVYHGGMSTQHVLNVGWVNIEPAGYNHVFDAPADEQSPGIVDLSDIAGPHEYVPGRVRPFDGIIQSALVPVPEHLVF
jgi:hypothetical protein